MVYYLSRSEIRQSHRACAAVYGEVSEWFKELVLKTSDAKAPRVRISASPPSFSVKHVALICVIF